MTLIPLLLLACAGPDYGLESLEDDALAADGYELTDDLGDGGAFEAWERPVAPGELLPPFTEEMAGADDPSLDDDPEDHEPVGQVPGRDGPDRTSSLVDDDPSEEGVPQRTLRVERFAAGDGPTPVADYLFVLDESVSMVKILREFRQGFWSLVEEDPFPRRARLAVMNMTPGDPDDLSQPHPAVRVTNNEGLAPGFLHLVNGPRIAAFRDLSGDRMAERFLRPGCEPWFSPEDTNAEGQPCLLAHAQTSFAKTRAEAGLVAVKQWLELTEHPVRAGAAVNIIFVSDTHDPGLPPHKLARGQEADLALLDEQPDADELRELLGVPVASFRVHAIAPETECAEEWEVPSYFVAAEASGGLTADSCTLDDYAAFVSDIAATGARTQQPVFRLGLEASQVSRVEVDGESVLFEAQGQAVVLDHTVLSGASEVRIGYQTHRR